MVNNVQIPEIHSEWLHTNGTEYKVVLIANEHSDQQDKYPTTVVYTGKNSKVWSRPLSDWHRSMTALKDY